MSAPLLDHAMPPTPIAALRRQATAPPPTPEARAFAQALALVNQLVPHLVRASNEVAVRPDVREELRRLLPHVLALKHRFAAGCRKERRSS